MVTPTGSNSYKEWHSLLTNKTSNIPGIEIPDNKIGRACGTCKWRLEPAKPVA